MTIESKQVKTRRVYYIPGFDPRGARYYHRLYREEAAREAARYGYAITVGDKRAIPGGNVGWSVDASWPDGQTVHTDYCFLVWDDIVRKHWEKNVWMLLGQCLLGYRRYFVTGVLARITHVRRYFGAVLPIVYVAFWGLALVIVLLLWVAGSVYFMQSWLLGILGAAALSFMLFRFGQQLGNRLGIFWLMRTILFVEKWGSVGNMELEARINQFAAYMLKDLSAHPVDEVLLVGHSVGTVIAPAVASRYLQASASDHPLTLVTLGQCIPLLAYIPAAEAYRNEVAALAADSRIRWFDVSALADTICFFDENPALACNVPEHAPGITRMVHARIFRMFTPETYRKLKGNKLRLHFQYLMSAELDTGYDYFRLTAGPVPAAAMLGGK